MELNFKNQTPTKTTWYFETANTYKNTLTIKEGVHVVNLYQFQFTLL
jgi:hypothetical protein